MHKECNKCGKPSVYSRPYSGQHLCALCFIASIEEKVKRTIAKYDMLEHNDRIAVAVSGGKDSLALVRILKQICSGHDSSLEVITIDEGIAGYRDEGIQLAKEISTDLGLRMHLFSYEEIFGMGLDEALRRRGDMKITACSTCGPFRRRAIDLAARKIGATVIATGHNLDDIIQTHFINTLSGDFERIRQLDPILRPKNPDAIRRIKPLMEIYEREIAFHSYVSGNRFQNISCPYMNEGIRSEIRQMLNALEKEHSGIKYTTLRAVIGIAQSLDIQKDDSASQCLKCGEISSNNLCQICHNIELLQMKK
ncbi:MAG: TIGR00269 family protein [Thaumarchaeota archaeon]|jgi:uncharacterized protein (TIGR00269 family)|nr:TIGR00269 family protein [Nitrososphaerota archaeon]|tara:strand:- start:168 stop:1094 length:927 start_codon:yes stop_codon:yes gene_type:complete